MLSSNHLIKVHDDVKSGSAINILTMTTKHHIYRHLISVIVTIYFIGVPNEGFYTKGIVNDLVKQGYTVRVNIELIAETSSRGEKYVNLN